MFNKLLKDYKVLSKPLIMGIINVTPDSFFESSRVESIDKAICKIDQMVKNGMDVLDIGAMSSRPGSDMITEKEELNRIKPVFDEIVNQFPDLLISIDTIHSKVASYCLNNGAHIINDISSGKYDKNMYSVIQDYQVPYIIMHMLGDPKSMQQNPSYKNVVLDVYDYFKTTIDHLENYDIDNVIIDPGFGFGKSIIDNYKLLKNIDYFEGLNKPILIGISRKSMIYKLLESTANEVLPETTALHWSLLDTNVNIIRVHDVKELNNIIKISQLMKRI